MRETIQSKRPIKPPPPAEENIKGCYGATAVPSPVEPDMLRKAHEILHWLNTALGTAAEVQELLFGELTDASSQDHPNSLTALLSVICTTSAHPNSLTALLSVICTTSAILAGELRTIREHISETATDGQASASSAPPPRQR